PTIYTLSLHDALPIFLKIGHADHVHAPTAVDVRFGFRRKLWPFHAEIGSAEFAHNARFLAGTFQNAGEFRADGICEGNVGDNAIDRKSTRLNSSHLGI